MLILKENIIVSGEDFKLGINLRTTIIIDFYNSGFIRNLCCGFSLQVESVFRINCCVLCVFFFSHPTFKLNEMH